MIVNAEGETSTTKSTFLYSAPPPVVNFAFDAGADRALYGVKWEMFKGLDIDIRPWPHDVKDLNWHINHWKRNDGKSITVYLIPYQPQEGVKVVGAIDQWTTYVKLCNAALLEPSVTTVGTDTMTIGRRVAADAYLQVLQGDTSSAKNQLRVQLIEVEWGTPGKWVRSVYTTAQNQCESAAQQGRMKNFIVTHHRRPVRTSRMDAKGEMHSIIVEVPGHPGVAKMELEGLADTMKFLDIDLLMEKTQVQGLIDTKKVTGVEATLVKCGYDISLEGTKLINPNWDSLAMVLNPRLPPTRQIRLRGSNGHRAD